MKRLLSLGLCLFLAFSMIPTTALAEEAAVSAESSAETQESTDEEAIEVKKPDGTAPSGTEESPSTVPTKEGESPSTDSSVTKGPSDKEAPEIPGGGRSECRWH